MKFKLFFIVAALSVSFCFSAQAQYAAQKEAAYMATIKAVADYKINDAENLKNVQKLREDARFNRRLSKMLEKLQNTRTKDSRNQRIYDILLKAGEEIYKELD